MTANTRVARGSRWEPGLLSLSRLSRIKKVLCFRSATSRGTNPRRYALLVYFPVEIYTRADGIKFRKNTGEKKGEPKTTANGEARDWDFFFELKIISELVFMAKAPRRLLSACGRKARRDPTFRSIAPHKPTREYTHIRNFFPAFICRISKCVTWEVNIKMWKKLLNK